MLRSFSLVGILFVGGYMYNITCVCLGNICRSPLAEAVLQREIEKRGLQKAIGVDSSGTSGWHKGELADPRMRSSAERRGIHITSRSDHFQPEHFEKFDLILVMDNSNYRNVVGLTNRKEYQDKVRLFRDFDPEGVGEVPDPYYGGDKGFDTVIDMVERTAARVIDFVESELCD